MMFQCRRLNRRWAGRTAAVACGILVSALTVNAGEAILKIIPEDALGFGIAKSIDTLDAKVGAFAKAAGLPVPPVANSLGRALGIEDGVDTGRPAAVVLTEGKSPTKPAVFLVIPTSDLNALMANWEPEEGDDGVWKVQVRGMPSLAAEKDGYAVVGDAKEDAAMKRLLAAKTNMVEETEPWHEWGAAQDVVVFVSRTGWKKAYERGREEMDKAVDSLPDDNPQMKQTKAGLEVYRRLFKAVGPEVECLAVGLTIDDDAVLTVTNKAKLVEGGTLEAALKEIPSGPENILVGLPNRPFVVAGAGGTDPGIMKEMMKFSFAVSQSMPGMLGGSKEQNEKLMELSLKTMQNVTGMGLTFCPPEEGGVFLSGMSGVIWTTGSDEYMKNYAAQVEKMAELAKEVPEANWFKGMKLEKADIDGVSGWKIAVNLSPVFDAMKDEPQAVEMVKRMYGESGVLTTYFAIADETHLAYAYSPSMLKQSIAAVKDAKESLAGSDDVTKVAGHLLDDPGWVGYLSPTGLVAMVNATMKNVGAPIQLPDFPKTLPVGFAAKYDGGMFTKQLVIMPQTVKDAVFYGLMLKANPPKPPSIQ